MFAEFELAMGKMAENGEALMPIFDDIQNYIRRQSCGDCCKQETRHTCCE